jgi:hypothetical protein
VNRIVANILTLGSCLLLIGCSLPAAKPATETVTATAVRLAELPEPESLIVFPVTPTRPPAAETLAPSETPLPPVATPPPTEAATAIPPTSTLAPSPTPRPTRTPAPTRTPRPVRTATPVVVITAMNELAARADGEIVTVSGRVVAVSSFSHGYKFELADSSGRIIMLLWHNVYDDTWDAPKLNLGATVRATGKVGRYQGELQLEPAFGSQVKVTAPAGALPPQREIGSLGEFMGQRVSIVGQVSRVQAGSQGTTLTVADESGEIAVFIWDSTLARIAGNAALGEAGARVRVTGFVSEYRSNRQIVPTLPYDVEVLP